MSLVVALVATHRPEREPLERLVRTLRDQGCHVVVADDASPCTSDPTLASVASLGARVVRHDRNAGIARSLNDGLRAAERASAPWLLTVDQDSVLPGDYLRTMLAAAEDAVGRLGPRSVGAVAAGRVEDPAAPVAYRVHLVQEVPTTPEVIQTGTLWSVPALRSIGGFDETFGIDAVDAAACVRLRASGRRLVLAPGASLAHRIGQGRPVRVMGRIVTATGHSPQRRSSMVRNRLRLAPEEFTQSPAHALRTLRRVAVGTVLAVTVEEDRWAKARASARGLLPRRDR